MVYLTGGADGDAIDAHLADCGACRLLVRLAAPSSERITDSAIDATDNVPTAVDQSLFRAPHPVASLGEGDSLGRYRIEAPLGAGGMSVVYAAYDPQLARRVALKLLHGPSTPKAGEQLMAEGRAVARLSHPNVVTVYDIAEDCGQWFVAMELVDGGTLSDWLRSAPRSSRQILAMFVAAGRGLAAAHAAGLVHRDFKPTNVLVGADQRPRVSDFGIALHGQEGPPAGHESTPFVGAAGTPAYMAPEQIDGRTIDARADQFSFSIALFEALDGRRPFPGTTLRTIRAAITQGPTKLRAFVPLRGIAALRRALSESPDDRFASMEPLLRALAPSPWRPAQLAVVACALIVGVAGAAALMREPAPAPCTDLERGLTGIWDSARRDALDHGFSVSGIPGADDTARAVRRGLDRYASSWIDARKDTCEAAQIQHVQTSAQAELRTVCLDERLSELRAVTDLLVSPDLEIQANAHALVASLTPPEACADLATLTEKLPVARSFVDVVQIRSLRDLLTGVRAQVTAGEFEVATSRIAVLREIIDRTKYRPLQAEAALVAGILADKQGYLAQSDKLLGDAVLHAEAGRDKRTEASAWLQLVHVRARGRGDVPGATDALAHATAVVEGLGSDLDATADLAFARGVVMREAGKYDDSRLAFAEAIRLLQRSRLDRTVYRARIQLDLAGVIGALGDLGLARSTADGAVAEVRKVLGASHPDLAGALVAAAAVATRQLDLATASSELDEAERILGATVGREHPRYAQLLMVRANVLLSQEQPGDAVKLFVRAFELFRQRFGEDHSLVANLHRMIATALISTGDTKRARSELAIAASLFERSGHDSIEAVQTRALQAWCSYAEDDLAAAETAARTSFAECRRIFGSDHPATAEASRALGVMLVAREKHVEAVAAYEEAIEIMRRAGSPRIRIVGLWARELGEVLLDQKRYEPAAASLASAVAIELANHAERTTNARTARFLLAEAYRGSKQLDHEVEVLEALVAEMASAPGGEADPMLHRARLRLGIDLVGDPKRARELVAAARVALAKIDPEAVRTAGAWLRVHRPTDACGPLIEPCVRSQVIPPRGPTSR